VSRAVVIESFGGPEVLDVRDREPSTPGPGQALVKLAASGVNYVDVYHRTGLYPLPLPAWVSAYWMPSSSLTSSLCVAGRAGRPADRSSAAGPDRRGRPEPGRAAVRPGSREAHAHIVARLQVVYA